MPPDHGLRLDHNNGVQAAWPKAIEHDPEGPVQPGQPDWGSLVALENFQLMAQGDDLELWRGAASEGDENVFKETRQEFSHGTALREGAAKDQGFCAGWK